MSSNFCDMVSSESVTRLFVHTCVITESTFDKSLSLMSCNTRSIMRSQTHKFLMSSFVESLRGSIFLLIESPNKTSLERCDLLSVLFPGVLPVAQFHELNDNNTRKKRNTRYSIHILSKNVMTKYLNKKIVFM